MSKTEPIYVEIPFTRAQLDDLIWLLLEGETALHRLWDVQGALNVGPTKTERKKIQQRIERISHYIDQMALDKFWADKMAAEAEA